ncbi:unnamed protein product [Callosobruchus maculatus]|uniref:Uncharacterized protein n=1 Tax=Callosobruchus maculatus TaxID=64391 RepID=A0A653BL10_CALMS|nr:unnamed protein product [Callosobruchus maculatus]
MLEENSISMYEISYAFTNEFKDEHDEMVSWCQNNLKKINVMHEDSILGKSNRGDIAVEEVPSLSQEGGSVIDNLVSQLKNYENKLAETENNLEELLQINRTHIITQNISADEIVLLDKSSVVSPNIDSINEIDIPALMSNTINVNEGFEINNLNFESMRVEEPIHPKRINHHNGILHRNKDIVLDKLNINGSAAFKNN